MAEVKPEFPDSIDALKVIVKEQASRVAELERVEAEQCCQLEQRDHHIEQLKEQVRLLLAQRFAPSSERVDPQAQLGLFNEAEAQGEEEPASETPISVSSHTRARRGRRPLPAHFPRHEVVYDLSEEDKVCPNDGTALKLIGAETSEQLDIIPAKVRVLLHKRLKYACPCCEQVVKTAPMAPQPIPKSEASPGMLAYVAVSNYADALPLYRQSKQLARIGVELPRATLASWMVKSGEIITPVINLLQDELLSQAYIHMDETTVQVLKEPGRRPESKSYLWARRSGENHCPIVLFHYAPSRSGAVAKALLGDFSGFLQTDGYHGYDAVVGANGITQLYCFAHARRYFSDVLKSLGLNPRKLPDKPPDKARRVMKGLAFIRSLYEIERRIRDDSAETRYRVRQGETKPALERLRVWVDETIPKVAPKTPLGKALGYLDSHWPGLILFCEDGRLNIDNNPVENHPALCPRAQELVVLRHRQRRQGQCQSLLLDRDRQAQWPGALRLPSSCLHRATESDHCRGNRGPASLPPQIRRPVRRLTVNPAGKLPLTMHLLKMPSK